MDLFNPTLDETKNWLPKDGTVNYYGQILNKKQSDFYFEKLLETLEWRNDEAIIFGKRIITKRKVAWYGDIEYDYTYSNTTKRALPWTNTLIELKSFIEEKTGEKFNSCLLNLYHCGEEGMAWHGIVMKKKPSRKMEPLPP